MLRNMRQPNGWFAVTFSSDVTHEKPVAGEAFGEHFVIWRAEDGRITVMDAYCPHLGAHLGCGGVVKGDTIACPFHGWTFNTDGDLIDVPYEKARPHANQRVWPSVEQDGVIMVWRHEKNIAPTWQPVSFNEPSDQIYVTRSWRIHSHPQDICENSMDVAHFRFVHGTPGRKLTDAVQVGDTILRAEIGITSTLDPSGAAEERLVTEVHGPGIVLAHLHSGAGRGLFRLYSTPVGDGLIDLRGMVSFHAAEGMDSEMLTNIVAEQVILQWEQDRPIWDNKIYRESPMLTRSEGAVSTYRKWYQRFYQDDVLAA
jgi:nitrite reductase/ring-hydroxylating ferredoxin subunit